MSRSRHVEKYAVNAWIYRSFHSWFAADFVTLFSASRNGLNSNSCTANFRLSLTLLVKLSFVFFSCLRSIAIQPQKRREFVGIMRSCFVRNE